MLLERSLQRTYPPALIITMRCGCGSIGGIPLFQRRCAVQRKSGHIPLVFSFAKTTRSISSTSSNDDLLLRNNDISSGITSLTLNNPKRYNVLSSDMLDKLQYQLDDIAQDSVRAYKLLLFGIIHPGAHCIIDDTSKLHPA